MHLLIQNIPESITGATIINFIAGLMGIITGAILSFLFQLKITKQIINADFRKIQTQIQTEYNFRNNQEWIIQVRNIIAELVTETDPEKISEVDRIKVLRLKNKMHLFIDFTRPEERKIIDLIDRLYSIINEWQTELLECEHYNNFEERREYFEQKDYDGKIFQMQGEILEKTRILLNSKWS